MKKLFWVCVLLCTCAAFNGFSQTNTAPVFTGGTSQTFHICSNAPATSINTLLAAVDSNSGQQLVWSLLAAPAHGTAAVSDTDTATATIVLPIGATYSPTAGYAGTDTFMVTLTDDSSATDTISIYVFVDTLPVLSITGSSTICRYDSTLLFPSVTGGLWSSSATAIATVGTGGRVHALATGVDTIYYVYTNVCGSDTASQPLTVIRIPDIGPITGYDSVCMGSNITLAAAHPGGTWRSSNALFASVDTSGVVMGRIRGSATITYTMSNMCGSAYNTHRVDINMTAQPIFGPTTICAFSTTPSILIELTPNGSWSSSNMFSAIVFSGGLFGLLPGTATITYTVNNACGRSTATLDVEVVDCTTGITTPTTSSGFSVYPNPSDGNFEVVVPSSAGGSTNIVVSNMLGVIVAQFTAIGGASNHISVDAPGVYLVQATNGNQHFSTRVTVNR